MANNDSLTPFLHPGPSVIPSTTAGYSLYYDETGTLQTSWSPIPNVYCPPVLHTGIYPYRLQILPEHQHLMGLIIGKEGIHFKNITYLSGSIYIYYLQDSAEVEIWGDQATIYWAYMLLSNHIYQVLNKKYWLNGYEHLPCGLRPLRVHRQIRNAQS